MPATPMKRTCLTPKPLVVLASPDLSRQVEIPVSPAPKFTQRRIVWETDAKGKVSGTAILLVGYCPDTLGYFLGLAADVLKTFPKAQLHAATCSKVRGSATINGYTVFMVPVPGPKRAIPGYDVTSGIDFNY